LLAIVANTRGAEEASRYKKISLIGYPFSVSETFQQRNTNSGIKDSFETVRKLAEIAQINSKELIIYISMAYGNPYEDPWNAEIVINWISKLNEIGIQKIALADTVGIAEAKDVAYLTSAVIREFPDMETGTHLHCKPGNWREKVAAAYESGCRYFDTAMRGYGGCPMAGDDLTGNLATENLLQYLQEKNVETRVRPEEFKHAQKAANLVFLPTA
jgi:hydroxymethylglutaryl-CoA lyase